MPHLDTLAIAPAGPDAPLTPDQQRFHTLIGRLERARQTIAEWEEHAPRYAQVHAEVQGPLLDERRALRREWVLALDVAHARKGWTRNERAALADLIEGEAGDLLWGGGFGDVELEAVYARHSDWDLKGEHEKMVRSMERPHGDASVDDQGDEGAEAPPPDAPDTRSASQKEADAQAQLARQSVREVFRKLASALHPDREPDAEQRKVKTALMQRVNQAYDRNDLLTLLTLQAQTAQLDTLQAVRSNPQQVQHFNQVLATQLDGVRDEIRAIERDFRMDFRVGDDLTLNPRKLDMHLAREAAEIRDELQQMRADMAAMVNVATTRRWLQQQRAQDAAPGDRGRKR